MRIGSSGLKSKGLVGLWMKVE